LDIAGFLYILEAEIVVNAEDLAANEAARPELALKLRSRTRLRIWRRVSPLLTPIATTLLL
jgi:hypothetical protein